MCGLDTGLVCAHGRHIFLSETAGALVRPHLGAEWALKECSDPVGDDWTDFYPMMSAED